MIKDIKNVTIIEIRIQLKNMDETQNITNVQ